MQFRVDTEYNDTDSSVKLPPCKYRGPKIDNEFLCSNTYDLLHNGTVPISVCTVCPYAVDYNSNTNLSHIEEMQIRENFILEYKSRIKQCGGCPDPHITVVPAREGRRTTASTGTIRREEYISRAATMNPIEPPTDRDWSVVVTTSPRTEPTIDQCIESIKKAGWNPVVFAEPDSIHLPDTRYVANEVKLGAWFNWLKSVKWALKNTISQYIMTVQDDSLFHPDSRSFVESVMWPSNNMGFLSLYTASHYSADLSGNLKPFGLNKLRTTNLWGACALVFPRSVLQTMIEHPVITDWRGIAPKDMDANARVNFNKRREETPHLIQNVDSAIGRVLTALHLDMYVIDPSPVHHIATHSAIHHGSNTGKRNCGRCSDHSIPLSQQVFPNHTAIAVKRGTGSKIREAIEAEIGYTIVCDTCLEFFRTLDSNNYNDIQDLVLKVFTNAPFPDEWRKKYKGRTMRLQRIEEIIKPLLST